MTIQPIRSVDVAVPSAPPAAAVRWWRLGAALVVTTAFCCRLLPTVRGGGLYGIGSYDDGVHVAAAIGLVHGALPYRDFLFLQPPGVLLALAPFAWLGSLTHEGIGFAAARLAWMAMGGLNAVLVTRIAYRSGRAPALLGGLFYAVWWPAVHVERTTMLEGLGNLTLLLALWALAAADRNAADRNTLDRSRLLVLAGVALGLGAGVKIWGVLVALVVIGWQLAPSRIGRLRRLVPGTVLGAALVYLPFFLAGSRAMWRQVVLDQLGRVGGPVSHWHRLSLVLGLDPLQLARPLVAAVAVAALVGLAAAATVPAARLPALLVVVFSVLLAAITPNLFRQYPAVLAGPAALALVGTAEAVGRLLANARLRPPARRRVRIAGLLVLALVVASYAVPLAGSRLGASFPRQTFAAAVAALPGCLTSDEPTVLIELDQVGRTVDRGCRLVVDYGGYAYDLPVSLTAGRRLRIRDTSAWQAGLRDYLASGTAAFHLRNRGHGAAAGRSWAVWASWPVIVRAGRFVLRRPPG